jgi:O-antigen ligase
VSDRAELALVPFLGATLLVRVLTDHLSSPNSRLSGSLNLSGAIAVLFILVAVGLLLRARRGVRATVLAALWLCVWTVIAVGTRGASIETIREGVREGSVVALAVIVYNARGAVSILTATRLVQLVGFVPALISLYQLATHTGMDVSGNIRSYGTFSHPNSAAMFFAIAVTASLSRYFDDGRHRADALLTVLFAAAILATFSIDGLISLLVMLAVLGALRPGSPREKAGPWLLAGLIVLAFLASPLGSERVANESATSLASAERGEANSSLAWRLHRWKALIPEWERAPVFGQGLGTTTTALSTPERPLAGYLPHNEYLRYLVETGVVGLAILLAGLTLLLRRLVRKRRTFGVLPGGISAAPTLAIVTIIGCLADSLADNTLLDSPTCYAAVLIVVAVLSLPGVGVRTGATPTAV